MIQNTEIISFYSSRISLTTGEGEEQITVRTEEDWLETPGGIRRQHVSGRPPVLQMMELTIIKD